MALRRLDRTRAELSDFLRQRRERLSPAEAGLPPGTRRRTPGLRREEVATLAGVGVTWYTWLEQGREINVSVPVLERVARVLKLDETERHHLFLLAQQRPPALNGRQWCVVPPIVRRLLDDLRLRPAYVMNLRWDVIAWNEAAERLFGFAERADGERNMLWMLFADTALQRRIVEWEEQAPRILASFRRDCARAPDDTSMAELIESLERASAGFRELWRTYDIHGRCQGVRTFHVGDIGPVPFEHATFIVDEERHLRLVMYTAVAGEPSSARFEAALL